MAIEKSYTAATSVTHAAAYHRIDKHSFDRRSGRTRLWIGTYADAAAAGAAQPVAIREVDVEDIPAVPEVPEVPAETHLATAEEAAADPGNITEGVTVIEDKAAVPVVPEVPGVDRKTAFTEAQLKKAGNSTEAQGYAYLKGLDDFKGGKDV